MTEGSHDRRAIVRAKDQEAKAMAKQEVRRASFVVVFGDGAERWSMPDTDHPVVDNAQWRVRYGYREKSELASDALVLADTVSALHYLLHVCPTTKIACEKLAAMRAAVRKLGPVSDE